MLAQFKNPREGIYLEYSSCLFVCHEVQVSLPISRLGTYERTNALDSVHTVGVSCAKMRGTVFEGERTAVRWTLATWRNEQGSPL